GHSGGGKAVALRLALIVALFVMMGVAIAYAMPWAARMMSQQPQKTEPAEEKPAEEKPEGRQPAEAREVVELPSLKKIEIDWRKAEAYLSDVKDGTYGIIESGSLWLLKQARDLPRELFAPDPKDKEVSYRNLLEGPVLYRGKPVTVSGTVGRVSEFPVDIEELPSVETMWVVEIFQPSKGQQAWVCTLLVSEDPGDLKIGQSEVRMKGYFYKLRSYEVEDEKEDVWIHQCPVVVGRYVEVVTKQTGATPAGSLLGSRETVLIIATVVGLLVLMLIVLLFIRRFTARRVTRPQRELTPGELQQRREFLNHYAPGTRPGQPPDR
ncbi:MAG: hypothetical protein GWP05_08200, partial [Anaerolineaceae bacterium]|nr:hypothetical protein [Anaerolineaceae bacterium]